jgi:hypothetical protein
MSDKSIIMTERHIHSDGIKWATDCHERLQEADDRTGARRVNDAKVRIVA